MYEIICVARQHEDQELSVVYTKDQQIWVRPLSEFVNLGEDGKQRFVLEFRLKCRVVVEEEPGDKDSVEL